MANAQTNQTQKPFSTELYRGKNTHYVITVKERLNDRIVQSAYVDETTEIKALKAAKALPVIKKYLGSTHHNISMRANPITIQQW